MEDQIQNLSLLVTDLIESDNFWNNFLIPGLTFLLSTMIGAFVSYKFFKLEKTHELEKAKLDSANKTTLKALTAMSSLFGIKENYYNHVTEHPIQRAININSILHTKDLIDTEVSDLTFMAPTKKSKSHDKWQQIMLIHILFSNYNQLILFWQKRSEMINPIRDKLSHGKPNNAEVFFTETEIYQKLSRS
jgi:hypothetical protein